MPFYIRKAISAGPFRFNLSKSGLGLSLGVKGLRIGTGPRGHYIHAGRHGFYYRASLGNVGRQRPVSRIQEQHHSATRIEDRLKQPIEPAAGGAPDVEMVDIDSGDVLEMRDERFQDLIDEINEKCRQFRASIALGLSGLCVAVIVAFAISVEAAMAAFGLAVIAYLVGKWIDSYRRSTVLFYNFEPDVADAYGALVRKFEDLASCSKVWHISSGGKVRDLMTWKRNAGATQLIARHLISLKVGSPDVIKSNIDVPFIPVGAQTLYFFPDFMMIYSSGKAGIVRYNNLELRVTSSNYIEDETVPADSKILYYEWQYRNKRGGPDRRFKDNRQLPVCAYENVHISSSSGVNELIELSCRGRGEGFAVAVTRMAGFRPTHSDQEQRVVG
jgi:Protein of unknown function (DUF4236)